MSDKKFFALKLIPPRPTFMQDMTGEERNIMQQHVVYWAEMMKNDIAIVYGPVLDPKGAYGLGVVAVDSEEQLEKIIDKDPALQINKCEYFPMLAIVRNP